MEKASERVVSYPSVGDVRYVKKRGIRRVSIVLKPFKGVIVSVPYTVSYETAEHFVLQKSDWIVMARAKMERLESRKSLFTESTEFRTRQRTLQLERHAGGTKRIAVRILEQAICVSVPEDIPIEHPTVQSAVVTAIERAWAIEAKEHLPERVASLAAQYGFSYSGLSVKKIRSRWGSCSSVNNINLSIYLMNLPDHLIDYVILHELCHTVEKNHGPKFWKLLDNVSQGRAKELAKQMKGYSTRYF